MYPMITKVTKKSLLICLSQIEHGRFIMQLELMLI